LVFQELVSIGVNADPLIRSVDAYFAKLSLDGAEARERFDATEEAIAARAFQIPPFDTLTNLTVQDVIAFRGGGGLDIMRSAFRSQRKRIKFASPETFDAVANGASAALRERIEEHNSEVAQMRQELERRTSRVRRDVAIGIGLLALNIASIPFPWLGALLWPPSITVGGPSALQIIRDKRQVKTLEKELVKMGRRPMGILAGTIEDADVKRSDGKS
jgi:hypothetical protein